MARLECLTRRAQGGIAETDRAEGLAGPMGVPEVEGPGALAEGADVAAGVDEATDDTRAA